MYAYVQRVLKEEVRENAEALAVRDVPRMKLTLLQSDPRALLPKESSCCNMATD